MEQNSVIRNLSHSIQWLNQVLEEITKSDKGQVDFFKDGKWYKAYDLKQVVDEQLYSDIVFTYNSCITLTTHFCRLPIITVCYNSNYKHILLTNEEVIPPNDPIGVLVKDEQGKVTFTEDYVKLSDVEIGMSDRCYYQLPIYNIVRLVDGHGTKRYIAMKVYVGKYTSPKHVNGDTLTDGLQHNFVTLDFKRPCSLPDVKTLLGMEYDEEVSTFKPADCEPTSLKGISLVVRHKHPSPYVFSV